MDKILKAGFYSGKLSKLVCYAKGGANFQQVLNPEREVIACVCIPEKLPELRSICFHSLIVIIICFY